MKKLHARRKRRSANMTLRSKGKFKVGHKRKGGRTGSSKPGRKKLRYHSRIHVTPLKAPRPRAFIFGAWCLCDKVTDAIEQQERFESIAARRMSMAPDISPEERAALGRVYRGCMAERDLAYRACSGHERFVFDHWRGTSPGLRLAIKVVLTDHDIGRKHPARKALAARPLTEPADDVDWYALSNGLGTVMPDGTRVEPSEC